MVAQLQAQTAVAAPDSGPLDPVRALQGGYVPKQDLISAMQRSQALEQELSQANMQAIPSGDTVSRREYDALVRKSNDLEEEVRRQISIVQSHQTGPGNDQIERMCVMALPAAVSALHSLSEETGHASSATWALVRAEDYVAHLASSRYPLSIPGLVTCIVNGANPEGNEAERTRILLDTQDACLAMSVISWDPEGRNMLLRDSRTVPSLLSILAHSGGMQTRIHTNDNAWGALNVPAQVICSRFAAMTLGNFSLDEGGRLSIVREMDAMAVLLEAIAGDDTDTSSFSLLCAGNLFMIPEARQRLLMMGGAVEIIFNRLSSNEAMTIRFAAGAVRNFAADDACREAVTKVKGSVAILQDLSRNINPRIRDHAEHALFNLRMLRHSGGSASVHSTPLLDNEAGRGNSAKSAQQSRDRSAFENIGANLFGMA